MGALGGPFGELVTYDVSLRLVRVSRGDSSRVLDETIFAYLERQLDRLSCRSPDLPFDFNCGFVGYFGYEVKGDCGGSVRHRSRFPDAAFLFADRLIAFDHLDGCVYLVALGDGRADEARKWLDDTKRRLSAHRDRLAEEPHLNGRGEPPVFTAASGYERYLAAVERCREHLLDGETYEVCLTNQIRTETVPDALLLYRKLRRLNPAPFSALLRFGDVAIACSSPERFLRIDEDGWIEAKPIKGTAPRGSGRKEDVLSAERLRTSEKDRAENLMIVDLLRNDLGRVSEVGSVSVPRLMEVETFETVHQLVSTVRGRLKGDLGPVDCVRACFPGGSMTGAPKKRTMEIIDELEPEARGVYSGSIGYFGLGGGADLNIVIRTIVLGGGSASIGAGGAIVAQSDPESEYREMLLKAEILMKAVALASGSDGGLALRDGAR